ncbi:MAG: VacB/RNase II family 3'-5' exoribonuclease [Deltaproteobacteria bacterium]|nr:VacB/RNase II family 3'-5' exoribonuclease [Deltaproteobacteria bacterium]
MSITSEQVLTWFQQAPDHSFHLAELLERLPDVPGRLKLLKSALAPLLSDRLVDRVSGQRFRLSTGERPLRGRIEVDRSGVATFVADVSGDVLPLSPKSTRWLGHGDHVEARLTRMRRGGLVAEVGAVISDPDSRELGVLRRVGPSCFVEAEPRRGRNFVGPPAIVETLPDPPPADGQLVEYRVIAPRTPTRAAVAEITRVLGQPGDRSTEILRLFLEHELPTKFPEGVEAEVAPLDEPSEDVKQGRVDLRSFPLVTIDGETAKDFDDAVCALPDSRGYRVIVAIADVAFYVRRGTELDREATARGTSTYLTDRVVPMLPEKLSNSLCSLVPHEDRLCFVADLAVTYDGSVVGSKMYRGVMRSFARLTYTRVSAALDGQPDPEIAPLVPMLDVLADVAEALYRRRIERGAVDLDLAEPVLVFDAAGNPTDSKPRERNRAHRLIEDLMLAANSAVAAHFEALDRPTLFRVHDRPDPDKLVAFVELANELGFDVGSELLRPLDATSKRPKRRGHDAKKSPKPGRLKVTPRDVARIAKDLAAIEGGTALHGQLLRCMAQARYDVDNEGHFGLASHQYLHFTSPIRRYPDLMVHRLLADTLGASDTHTHKPYSREELAAIADSTSKSERRAMAAERASLELDRTYVAALHVGRTLKGKITGVQAFGLFVATEDPFIEGLIPIATLGADFFIPSEHGSFLFGQRTGRRFALGEPIEVEVADVDFLKRQVELRLVEPTDEGAGDGVRRPSQRLPRSQRAKVSPRPERARQAKAGALPSHRRSPATKPTRASGSQSASSKPPKKNAKPGAKPQKRAPSDNT